MLGPRGGSAQVCVWLGLDRRTGQYIVYDGAMGGSGMREPSYPCRYPRSGPQRVCNQWQSRHGRCMRPPSQRLSRLTPQDRLPRSDERGYPWPDACISAKKALDDHGYTKNCQKYQHLIVYGTQWGTPHRTPKSAETGSTLSLPRRMQGKPGTRKRTIDRTGTSLRRFMRTSKHLQQRRGGRSKDLQVHCSRMLPPPR